MCRISQRFASALVIALCSLAGRAEPVQFVDHNLEYAFEAALNFPSEGITTSNILLVTDLNACCAGIADLGGLEHAHGLEYLDLSFNNIYAVSFPPGLSNLLSLKLNGNGMTNLQFPSDLLRLRYLDLAENEIKEFSAWSNLTALAVLNLELNNLDALALPATLSNLVGLNIGYNRIRDLAFLEPFSNLITLNLDDNGLRAVSLPASVTNLMGLTISINRITNFAFLSQLPMLSVLDISANLLTSIDLPPDMFYLGWINLAENRLRRFNAPAGWSSLSTLHLGDNLLTNVCIEGLSALEQLGLSKNLLSHLFIPPGLPLLRYVDLQSSPMAELTLPVELAEGNLSNLVHGLRMNGVQVQAYPGVIQVGGARSVDLSFEFRLEGPPGRYAIHKSADLQIWDLQEELLKDSGPVLLSVPRGFQPRFFRAARVAACQ